MLRILVTDLDGEDLGSVSILGTTHIALDAARDRASKLAASKLGYAWGIAWITGRDTLGRDSGRIEVPAWPDSEYSPGKTVATWCQGEV